MEVKSMSSEAISNNHFQRNSSSSQSFNSSNNDVHLKVSNQFCETTEKKLTFEEEHSPNCKVEQNIEYKSENSNILFNDNEKLTLDPKKENLESADFKISETDIEHKFLKRTTPVLQLFSLKELRLLVADLSQTVNEISGQLVSLLQENDTLRQESDARYIAIEQLLKLTVKQSEIEVRPVKLSVISTNETDDNSDVEESE